MTIRERVETALNLEGMPPVYFGGWKPAQSGELPPDTYVVYTTISRPNMYADNVQHGWKHYVYLNIWYKDAVKAARDKVTEALSGAGFAAIEIDERKEESTGMGLCAMTWFYLEAG